MQRELLLDEGKTQDCRNKCMTINVYESTIKVFIDGEKVMEIFNELSYVTPIAHFFERYEKL